MELNSIEELNKLEAEIKETQRILKNNDDDKAKIKKLTRYRTILFLLFLLFLSTTIWLYYLSQKKPNNNVNNGYKYVQVNKDSLRFYKDFHQNFQINDVKDELITKLTLKNEKIIYNVQLGAFQNFKLTSDNLMNLKEFTKDGYTKLSVGNYSTYTEALTLKYNLKKLGFSDCFIIAQSYGNEIDIIDALSLSNETEYLQ